MELDSPILQWFNRSKTAANKEILFIGNNQKPSGATDINPMVVSFELMQTPALTIKKKQAINQVSR